MSLKVLGGQCRNRDFFDIWKYMVQQSYSITMDLWSWGWLGVNKMNKNSELNLEFSEKEFLGEQFQGQKGCKYLSLLELQILKPCQ